MTVPAGILDVMKLAGTMPADAFVDTHVLAGNATICTPNEYLALRTEVAHKLGVPGEDVRLIGSARLGFSLNQDHLLKMFGAHSDLDFVVAASQVFDDAALELAENAVRFALAGEDEKRRLRKTKDNVFHGYLRADQLPLSCSLSKEWFPRLAGPFDHDLARRYPIKAWLFKSIAHARIQYTNHQLKVQPDIVRLLQSRGDL